MNFIQPIWDGNIMNNESGIFLKHGNGIPYTPLLFDATEIISVQSLQLTQTFEKDRDWYFEDNKIFLTPNSILPYFTTKQLSTDLPSSSWTKQGKNGKHILHQESAFFHNRAVAITYRHTGNTNFDFLPSYQGDKAMNFFTKLKEGKRPQLLLFGDSISVGANSSKSIGAQPLQPSWGELVINNLEEKFNGHIEFINKSVGGKTSNWAVEEVDTFNDEVKPDIAIIAFGMNDGTMRLSPEIFEKNIKYIMNKLKSKNEKVTFILISPMLANPYSMFVGTQESFQAPLTKLAGNNNIIVNMTTIHQELLKRKKYIDLTGNNINHPNDFLIRCYADGILRTLLE